MRTVRPRAGEPGGERRLDGVRGVGRALWRWKLRDPDQGPPERLAAGRVRGPDGHRRAGGDRALRSGRGPVLAPRPAGPDSVAGPGVGRDPTAPHSGRRACRRVRAAAVTALDRLAVPGWDAFEAIGATARVDYAAGTVSP